MLSLFRHTIKCGTPTTTALTTTTVPIWKLLLFPLGKRIDATVLNDVAIPLAPSLSAGRRAICLTTIHVTETQQQFRYFSSDSHNKMENKTDKMPVDKEELRKRLTPMQYQVTQEAATERPFTGCYNKHYEKGIYQCIVCHQDLFSSDTKYDSGCGWPAFYDVLNKGKITLHRDASIPGMVRTEVRCSKCSAHMGHVFDDGPAPKYQRYCINSASIDFVPFKPTPSPLPSASASASALASASSSSSSANKAASSASSNTAHNATSNSTNNQAGSTLKSNASNTTNQKSKK